MIVADSRPTDIVLYKRPDAIPASGKLLLEDGTFFLLLATGDFLLLEG